MMAAICSFNVDMAGLLFVAFAGKHTTIAALGNRRRKWVPIGTHLNLACCRLPSEPSRNAAVRLPLRQEGKMPATVLGKEEKPLVDVETPQAVDRHSE
jgi:hypothetical protein